MRRFTLACFGASAAAAVLSGCGDADAKPTAGAAALAFTPAVVASSATENGATPMFLSTATGARVVAWVSAPGGGEQGALNFSVSRAGETIAAQVRDPLGPIEPHGEAPPQLASDASGRIFALYAVGKVVPGNRFPASALRVVRSEDAGRTWSAPVTVNETGPLGEFGSHNFQNLSVTPAGVLVVTWLQGGKGGSGVAMSRSRDGGRTWEPTRKVYGDPSCPCCRTAVASDADGGLYLAWRAILPGDIRDVVVMKSADGGETWDEPVRPVAHDWVFPGCPHAGPALRVSETGAVHIAWWNGKEGEAGVWYGRSTDGGKSFQAQPLAVGKRSAPAHVQLTLAPSNRVLVAWDDGQSSLPRTLLRVSTDGGTTFGDQQLVSDPGVAASFPVLGVTGDSVVVAWSQMTAAAHHEKAAHATDMKDPKAVMGLPRVGQSEILLRTAKL